MTVGVAGHGTEKLKIFYLFLEKDSAKSRWYR